MKNQIFIASLMMFMIIAGCKKALEIDPKQSIDSSVALQSQEGIDAALISVYSRLQSYKQYGRDILAVAESLSDNTVHTGNSSHLVNEAANNRGYHLDHWQTSYYAINEINLILDALKSASYNEAWTASVKGQAYFLRALFYHNLARTYSYDPTAIVQEQNKGGVPLMLVGVDDVSKIGSLQRATIDDVYKQIYNDLQDAHTQFAKTRGPNAPHRVTNSAVSALFSRVALYKGDWQQVIDQVDQAISQTTAILSTHANYLADWRKAVHPESIFEVKFNESENVGSDRSLRATYTSRAFYESETFTIQGVIAADPAFYTIYDDNDVRKGMYRLGTGNNRTFHENYKFISKNGILNLDNVPVIRLSELYLNRAEAYFHLGAATHDKALEDLNRIRVRAGLTAFAATGDAILQEIQNQRRLELAFEGHRWFDLKRNGQDVRKGTGDVPFEDYRMLAPIPDREVKADDVLNQNFGY